MKERVLKKLKIEIDKEIKRLVELSKKTYIIELLYYLYELHIFRIYDKYFPKEYPEGAKILKTVTSLTEESFKYLIQILFKYGHKEISPSTNGIPRLNIELVHILTKLVNALNSKYEVESIFHLFDVKVSGKRDQYLEIYMNKVDSDNDVRKFMEYFLRIEIDNEIKKSSKKPAEDLFESFRKEFTNYEDLFLSVYEITIEEYLEFIRLIVKIITDRMKEAEGKCTIMSNGNIDERSYKTILNISICFIFNIKDIPFYSIEKYKKLIERLTFNPVDFDEGQLRFHLINRKPLLKIGKSFIVSPELLLDHIFTNTHYSLLESTPVKNEYKKRYSSYFLDKISILCSNYQYQEIRREVEIFDGKKQLGDLDLILVNKNGSHLVIEAKNHSLPLNVYFKDPQATKDHLQHLKDKWEDKVIKRFEYLSNNYAKLGISADFKYIVVSRFPEIISHYSKLIILSFQEFEHWLKTGRDTFSFQKIYNSVYKDNAPFSEKDIKELSESGLWLFSSLPKSN